MSKENKRHSHCWKIVKSDFNKDLVKLYQCGDKKEYHLLKKDERVMWNPDNTLWAIIVCEEAHVMVNSKKELEIRGTRYIKEDLATYLNENRERIHQEVEFK